MTLQLISLDDLSRQFHVDVTKRGGQNQALRDPIVSVPGIITHPSGICPLRRNAALKHDVSHYFLGDLTGRILG